MKWIKLGKIFDPGDHRLPNGCSTFAQAPQALVFDDFVRIYFSTRKQDKPGKYVSYVAFIDIDKEFKKILSVSRDTVIELGSLGCFDEHGIFPMNVVRYKDKIFGYTCGISRRASVVIDTSIGFAISDNNGATFRKLGDGPILTSSLHEPFIIGDPFVSIFDEVFHMWYIYGTQWRRPTQDAQPERTYKIGHAISSDGIAWKRDGRQLIEDKLPEESQALPTVFAFNNAYHMLFCYRHSFDFRNRKERGYRIGYALSYDMKSWKREDDSAGIEVSTKGWDSEMLCYPHVFKCNSNVYLLYNGNEFGRHGFGLAVLDGSSL